MFSLTVCTSTYVTLHRGGDRPRQEQKRAATQNGFWNTRACVTVACCMTTRHGSDHTASHSISHIQSINRTHTPLYVVTGNYTPSNVVTDNHTPSPYQTDTPTPVQLPYASCHRHNIKHTIILVISHNLLTCTLSMPSQHVCVTDSFHYSLPHAICYIQHTTPVAVTKSNLCQQSHPTAKTDSFSRVLGAAVRGGCRWHAASALGRSHRCPHAAVCHSQPHYRAARGALQAQRYDSLGSGFRLGLG